MNRELKLALIARFGTQTEAALAVGIHESQLSRLVRERAPVSKKQKKALSRIFGAENVNRFFGEAHI